ncbi:undecaprenyl-phosphate glucose phosphotransferase [Calidifontibacillus erzurumensis]|uniref:Undecaprenyl-phosphate glucose phosphotransferase n=1 Tax=Calidifontibacillus erzurumensis TaxID=2741433 RepID=A0A8J8KBK2_9BACI|nr:undecaprenyl-phosphate glucose phosphotransferase [Calidifontibacillus erzurumensis]NSL52029.1 undecaprenyl-phosphate glucose phosphotransferase [Calidifontibacillus erzurumensis]
MIRGRERFLTQMYVMADFIAIQIAFLLAWFFRFQVLKENLDGVLPFQTYFFWSIIYGFIAIAIGYVLGIYVPKRKKKFAFEMMKVFQIHIFSMFMLLSLLFLFKVVDLSRYLLILYFAFCLIFVVSYRLFVKISLRTMRRKGYNKQFILVIGAGELGRRYYDTLMRNPEFGFQVIGFLDDYVKSFPPELSKYGEIIGTTEQLSEVLENKLVDEVVVALPIRAHNKYRQIVEACEKAGVRTSIIPDFYDILPASPHFDTLGDIPLVNVRDVPLDDAQNRMLKRLFDIVFSICAIIITLPLMILIAIGIKLTSPGPIIFKQERVGLNRRTFQMYKFRSMKHMPESVSNTQWTTANDPRRTKFGTFLRKTSLDELPQFFNVLKGDMSVVGPRPERPYFVDRFKEEIPKYMIKHHVRPGITGWAQVCGLRGDTSIKDRIVHDIFYIENWSFLFDIKIILKTIVNGFVNKNAY